MKVRASVVDSFRVENDPRLLEANEKVQRLESQLASHVAKLQNSVHRQQQIGAELPGLDLKVLLGEASEQAAQSMRAQRNDLDRESDELRVMIGGIKARLEEVRVSRGSLEAILRRDARCRAMAAYRAAVERLEPILREAATVNDELWSLFEFVNLPGLPGPWTELLSQPDSSPNSPLDYWLAASKSFNWKEYGA